MFLALFATFASDSMAYFIGSLLGKRRLAPSISPSKTWEGAIGGVLGGVAISLLVVFFFDLPVSWPVRLYCFDSIVGQSGDRLNPY